MNLSKNISAKTLAVPQNVLSVVVYVKIREKKLITNIHVNIIFQDLQGALGKIIPKKHSHITALNL